MRKLGTSIRWQVISVTIISLLILAITLVTIDFRQQRTLLTNTERRAGVTLIRSVHNTIDSVTPFITTLSDIAELNTRLAELVELNNGIDFITVVDANGAIIFHSNSERQGITDSALANLPPDKTVLKTIDGYGQVYLTSLTFENISLQDVPTYQIIVASASEPIRSQLINDALSSIIVTVLFALVAAFIIIILIQFYFVRPVEQLTGASEAIEAGDLTRQVDVRQNNEIGKLALSFNRMTHQLASLINRLEERVLERTLELEIARDQAEQASRAKSDFLSNMSHELRTPLNMVIGYTSSMLTMPQMYNHIELPEIYRQDIQLILDSGKHLLSLINDILDLSKVEAGKLELNCTGVDLNVNFESAIAISLGLIGEKPLQLRRNYPENLPVVWADTIRVRQILLNLLSNAIKYTETGSVTLIAEVRHENVYIAVKDTGPGIPEESLSVIFDRFQQIQNKSEIQGTGLGLDISQRLVQLHGSEITIESTPGIGSTFAFTMPIATTEQLATKQDTGKSMKGNTELFTQNASLQKMSVVIASDTIMRAQLRQSLEAQGVVVVEATDGERAIDLVTGLLPDFILIDTDIQKMETDRIMDMLQQNPETQNIPVISIKNGNDSPDISNHEENIIQKPVAPDKISSLIEKLS